MELALFTAGGVCFVVTRRSNNLQHQYRKREMQKKTLCTVVVKITENIAFRSSQMQTIVAYVHSSGLYSTVMTELHKARTQNVFALEHHLHLLKWKILLVPM